MIKTILFIGTLLVFSVCTFAKNLDKYPQEERLRPQGLLPGMWQTATPSYGTSITGNIDGLVVFADGPVIFPRIGLKNGWELSAFPFPYFSKRLSNTDIIDSMGQCSFLPSVVLRGGFNMISVGSNFIGANARYELGIKKVFSKRSWYQGAAIVDIPITNNNSSKSLTIKSITGYIQNGLGVQLTYKTSLFVSEDLGLHCLFDSNRIDGYGVTARLPIILQKNISKSFTAKLKVVPTVGNNFGWVDCFGGMVFQW